MWKSVKCCGVLQATAAKVLHLENLLPFSFSKIDNRI